MKTNPKMKTQFTKTQIVSGLWLALLAPLLACHAVRAQTLVSGNISGTWTPAGNPYVATDNCTVPSGQTLTIQPGVIVWIGENHSITANGLIQAVGTPSQRITFQAPISSQYWSNIFLIHESGTNRFKYCDFRNARTAISMGVYGGNAAMNSEIMNCTFSNCISGAIYGESQGITFGGIATLDPIIKNCVFESMSNACVIRIFQDSFGQSFGYANPKIIGNIFKNVTGIAFRMVNESGGSSQPVFLNNTLFNCRTGVDSGEPWSGDSWDAKVQSCIFIGCSNAVVRSGSASANVSYNDFFANGKNFTGYPGTYGLPIIANRNGTSCDLLYNTFQDPQFVATNDFHFATNSPCIDAGTPDWAFTDMCFPPSLGTSFPDQGAYGGPDAANWLDVVPKLPVQASISKSNNIIQVSWGALPRSEYQIQYVTNFVSVGTNNWLNLTNGKVLGVDKPTSLIVATNSNALNKQFFRIQSLGRTPGN